MTDPNETIHAGENHEPPVAASSTVTSDFFSDESPLARALRLGSLLEDTIRELVSARGAEVIWFKWIGCMSCKFGTRMGDKFVVFTVHAPNGSYSQYQAEYAMLYSFRKQLGELVLAGDAAVEIVAHPDGSEHKPVVTSLRSHLTSLSATGKAQDLKSTSVYFDGMHFDAMPGEKPESHGDAPSPMATAPSSEEGPLVRALRRGSLLEDAIRELASSRGVEVGRFGRWTNLSCMIGVRLGETWSVIKAESIDYKSSGAVTDLAIFRSFSDQLDALIRAAHARPAATETPT